MAYAAHKQWIIHESVLFNRGIHGFNKERVYWAYKYDENNNTYIFITTKNTVMNRNDTIRNDLFIFKSIKDVITAINIVTDFIKEEEFKV